MGNKKLVVPGNQQAAPSPYTEDDLNNAAKDAALLLKDSPAIAVCMNVDITARRLFIVARGQMDAILEEGWEIENPALVVQTLVVSAQERAARTQFKVAELKRTLVEDVLPFLNLLVEREQQLDAEEAKTNDSKQDTAVAD
jgi:hypothetical protein